jgi:DNA-binding MarR family transcriptional regulator
MTASRPRRRPSREIPLGFRLAVLASLRSTQSARRYEQMSGLKNLEGRALCVLGSGEGMSLKQLVHVSGIEKAYASRTVAALVDAGLIEKSVDSEDRRAVRLVLTPKGREVHAAVVADAKDQDSRCMSVLSAEERRSFADMVDRLTERARLLAEADRRPGAPR